MQDWGRADLVGYLRAIAALGDKRCRLPLDYQQDGSCPFLIGAF